MLVAKDFRDIARRALEGRWGVAIGTGLLAGILGAATVFTGGGSGGGSTGSSGEVEVMFTSVSSMSSEELMVYVTFFVVLLVISLVMSLVFFVIGGPITLGYVRFNLNLVDGAEAKLDDLFSQFNRLGDGFVMQLLRHIIVTLWMLLLTLPGVMIGIGLAIALAVTGASEMVVGIACGVGVFAGLILGVIVGTVKEYSYAMAPYILYENPGMKASDSLKASKQMMIGNKWRLFCMLFSFTGWALLSVFFTCGIGHLWLTPYQEAACAAFYREISAQRYSRPTWNEYGQTEQTMNTYDSNPYEEGSYF